MGTKLYVSEEGELTLLTDASKAEIFIEEFGQLMNNIIGPQIFINDWHYFFEKIIPQVIDLVNSYKGYKNKVEQKTSRISGKVWPNDTTRIIADVNTFGFYLDKDAVDEARFKQYLNENFIPTPLNDEEYREMFRAYLEGQEYATFQDIADKLEELKEAE